MYQSDNENEETGVTAVICTEIAPFVGVVVWNVWVVVVIEITEVEVGEAVAAVTTVAAVAAIVEIVEDLARLTLAKALSASAPICALLFEVIRLMTSLGMVGMSDDWKLVPLSVPAFHGSRSMITVSFHLPSLPQRS